MRRPSRRPSFTDEGRGVRFPALLGALLAIVLVACSSAATPPVTVPPGATASTQPAATGTPTPAPSASAVTFPLTLTDDEGTRVAIPAEPRRIVSLTPATTELLFALGIGDRVVAKVEDVADYPTEARNLPVVATFNGVDVEKIVGLGTDLVIAGGNNFVAPDSIAKLRSLGVPVLVVYAPDTATVFHDLELTGQAVGRAAEAKALADGLRGDFDRVAAATKDLPKPRVFYEIDATGAIYGPADDSFLAQMIELAGGDPVTTGSPDKFDIPLERLIEADPQVVLLGDGAYGVTADQVATRPGWDVMTAVKEKQIRPIDDVVVTRPGPRIGQGIRALAQAIHPDLQLP